jgi:site-specific DNA recombinase
MPSTNGHGLKRGILWAILYARVSTDEQARSGYSLAQQIEALRAYAAQEGYEILEEVTDPGQSGASLERPGMDRVRDLVAAGGVSVVLAQDRDRFAREPAYHYLLRKEFEEHGCKIRALNDRGDDSPEGELTDGILDQLAKYERAKIAERTRRGKIRKLKEGKLLAAGPRPRFGFDFDTERTGYLVDEEQMRVVRRIFEMVGGQAVSLHTVRKTLEREGVPAPNGGVYWSRTTIKNIVLDDVYRPHTLEELKMYVSPQVSARLDPELRYGISWWGRRKTSPRRSAPGDYRKRRRAVSAPKDQWIAVPVPDSGVPAELVDAARAIVGSNTRNSSAGSRFWELSGGVFYCGGCGWRMVPDRRRRKAEAGYHHYYRCETKHKYGSSACPLPKSYRAEETEEMVWEDAYGHITNPEQLREDLELLIEQKRTAMRGDPDREAGVWLSKLSELDRKRSGYLDLAADGVMTREELRAKLAAVEEARETARKELASLQELQQSLAQLEHDKEALLAHYEAITPTALRDLNSEERSRFYKLLGIKVTARPEGGLEVSYGEGVCELERTW